MKSLHLIEVKHLGATNTKGARIKLISHRFGDSVTLDRDYSINNYEQATHFLNACGVDVIAQAELRNAMGLLVSDFRPLKEIIKGDRE